MPRNVVNYPSLSLAATTLLADVPPIEITQACLQARLSYNPHHRQLARPQD